MNSILNKLDKKYYPIIFAILGVALIVTGIYFFYNPVDDNFSGYTYYRGVTASREHVTIPPSTTSRIMLLGKNAVLSDKKELGPEPFVFPMDSGYFTLIPYGYSKITLKVLQGSSNTPTAIDTHVISVRSTLLHEKCRYGIKKCSWPGLYVFTEAGQVYFQSVPEKSYIELTTYQSLK